MATVRTRLPAFRLALIFAVLLVAMVAVGALLVSPLGQGLLLGRAVGALDTRFGVIGHAERADLDLFSLEMRLERFTLATRDHEDRPFFTVDELHVDLPWSILWDEPSIQALELERPALSFLVDADGSSNLPHARNDTRAPGTLSRLPIAALDVRELELEWRNDLDGLSLLVGPMTATLSGTAAAASGDIELGGQASLRIGGEEIVVTRANGALTYDGSSISLQALAIDTAEATLVVDGMLLDLLVNPTLDLAIAGRADVAAIAERVTAAAIAGVASISADVTGSFGDPQAVAALSAPALRWENLAMSDVRADLRVTAGETQIDHLAARVAGGDVTASGALAMTGSQPSDVRLEWRELDVDQVIQVLAEGLPALNARASGDLDATWTALTPRAVTLQGRNRTRGGGGEGELTFEGRGGIWKLDLDQPLAGAAQVTGSVEGVATGTDWGSMTLDGRLSVVCGDVGQCLAAVADSDSGLLADPMPGNLRAAVRVGGSAGLPSVSASVDVAGLEIAGLSPITLTAEVASDLSELDVRSAEARLGDNVFRGQGRVAWDGLTVEATVNAELADIEAFADLTPASWTPRGGGRAQAVIGGRWPALRFERIAGSGTQLELTPLFGGTPDEIPFFGLVDVAFEGSGPITSPTGDATLAGTEITWGAYELGQVTATIAVDGPTIDGRAQVPRYAATADVVLDLDRREVDVAVDLTGADLGRLGAGTGMPLVGTASLSAYTSFGYSGAEAGTLQSGTVEVQLRQLQGSLGPADILLAQPATLRYHPEKISTDRLDLVVGATQLRLSGGLRTGGTDTLVAHVQGQAEDLIPLLTQVPGTDRWNQELDLAGAFNLEVVVAGSPAAPVISGALSLDNGRLGIGDHPALQPLTLRGAYRNGEVRLERLSGTWQGASIVATGELSAGLFELPAFIADTLPPGGALAVRADIDALTPATLVGYLDEATLADLDGAIRVAIDLEADALQLQALRGTLSVPQGSITLSGVSLAQRRETRLEIAAGQIRVAAFDWGSQDDYVTVGGTVGVTADALADLTVTAELDLRALSAFVPAATEGNALLIANIQGPVTDPTLNGTVELTDAGFRMAVPRLVVSELDGALLLTRDAMQLHELTGEANGGSLELSGTLDLENLRPQGEVLFVVRGIAMEAPDGLRTEADADLRLNVSADQLTLGGTVTILRGAYRETLTLTGGLLAALQLQESVTIVGIEEESPLDAIMLDVRLVTAEEIVIDNNYADGAVSFDVRVVGTVGSPGLVGRGALDEGGQLRLGSRVYEIEAGQVDFIDPTGIEPQLDIAARTRVSGRDISVTIDGVPGALVTSFQSDPPEAESDIVSLLLTGRTLDEVGVAPGAAARDQALGLVSGELLGTAGRSLGLDTVRLEEETSAGQIRLDSSLVASETNPGTRLTVGKNLSSQVQLVVSQNLRESGLLTWIVEYLPRRNIELRLVLDDEHDRAYEFRHALSFGGRPRAGAATTPRRREKRVGTVGFTGDLGLPEAKLRRQLRLDAGDRFDFYRWQQDRDSIERLYADTGYLESRVRPRRVEGTDGALTLTYEIVRGPRSTLTIEGYELPDVVVGRMRDAWTRAVFDDFLLEELSTLVRVHLAGEGFALARVDADVRYPNPDEKVIVVCIVTGQRASDRRIDFRGNERLTPSRLQAFVRQQGLEETTWVNEEELVRSVLGLYRSAGMLEARVEVGEPRVVTATATLPVRIAEGPVFTIADITLLGVVTRPRLEVEALVAPKPGQVYTGSGISDARRQIDQDYRQTGYNDVRVSARSTVNREANMVSVLLEVDEGPRQIIRTVEVVGGERTRANLVARALRITPGQPVDFGAWNLARKRLYDTGAFRSVDIQAEPLDPSQGQVAAEEQPVRARVVLEERPLYRLRYGLQVNDESAPLSEQNSRDITLGLVGDLTRQNFVGRAITLGTAFRWDADRRVARGFATVPSFFGLPITSNIFAAREHEALGDPEFRFITDLTRLTLEQRVRPRAALTVAYSYSFERNHTFDENFDPNDPFAFNETVDIARLNTSAVIDTRDDIFDAERGWFHSSTIEYGIEALGSQLRFAKYTAQQSHYWRVGEGVVLASAARLGLAAGFGQDLIPSERFFAGGGNTVRGYRQDGLGPLFFGLPDGGSALIVLNQEVRFPLRGIFRGVGFVDAGNVFPLAEDLALSQLKVGIGLGLRVATPFGLFRFDVAAPVSEIEEARKSRFFFSIGQAF